MRHRFRHTMGGKDHGTVIGAIVQFLDEDGALGFQALDDVAVVDDLVADVDRPAVPGQRGLNDGDGAVDAGAESARVGEQ